MSQWLEVVAALLRHPHEGRILLTLRPSHKVRGGCWEFPGGKLDPGETAAAALARELREELGISAVIGRQRLRLDHAYPDVQLHLHLYEVESWTGELSAVEVADWRWLGLEEQHSLLLSSADQMLLQRLRLPPLYRITPDCAGTTEALAAWRFQVGAVLQAEPRARVLLRVPSLDSLTRRSLLDWLCTQVADPARQLLVSHDVELALACGVGVHLSSAQLRCTPSGVDRVCGWRAGSCHNAEELQRALALGLDFVTLSPVLPTQSHPQAVPLGWPAFAELAPRCNLPVYALGGLSPTDLRVAWQQGATGVAGIRGLWTTGRS